MTLAECNKRIARIQRGLFVEREIKDNKEYYIIKFKDDRTGSIRNVMTVQDENMNPMPLDLSIIRGLKENYDWDMVLKHPNPDKYAQAVIDKYRENKRKKELEQMGFRFDFIKEHKKIFDEIIRNPHRHFSKKHLKQMEKEKLRNWHNKKIIV
jgi:hypothetical protein